MVREIYRLFIEEQYSVLHIVRELNRRGIRRRDGGIWKHGAVRIILSHPKYAGCHVYGRTSQKLCTAHQFQFPGDPVDGGSTRI